MAPSAAAGARRDVCAERLPEELLVRFSKVHRSSGSTSPWRRSQGWQVPALYRATSARRNGSGLDASSATVAKSGSADSPASTSECQRAGAGQERALPGVRNHAVASTHAEKRAESGDSAAPALRPACVNVPRSGSGLLVPSSSSTFGARVQVTSGAGARPAPPLVVTQDLEQEGFMELPLGTHGQCNSSTDMETGDGSSSEFAESWRSFSVSKSTESTRSGSSIATEDSGPSRAPAPEEQGEARKGVVADTGQKRLATERLPTRFLFRAYDCPCEMCSCDSVSMRSGSSVTTADDVGPSQARSPGGGRESLH